MNYYYDTEFLEGTQKTWTGVSLPTIDLISIGIVAEDGREYYAISKDFNLKEAWNRYDEVINKQYPMGSEYNKVYWIRDNVLKPIYNELIKNEINNYKGFIDPYYELELDFNYRYFKKLINKYGKNNKQIAEEIKDFVSHRDTNLLIHHLNCTSKIEWSFENRMDIINKKYPHYLPQFYGYYSDYDHVALCWLFGKMIDLPKGFPMYTIDLKQMLDERVSNMEFKKQKFGSMNDYEIVKGNTNLKQFLDLVKGEGLVDGTYPKQENEHSAIHDARWNKKLHEFIKQL